MGRFATLAAVATAYQAPPRTCPAVRHLQAPPLRATAAAGDVPATVSTLWRYPIKGFPPDSLPQVTLVENGTFPQDRLWAVADAADDGGPPRKAVHLRPNDGAVLDRLRGGGGSAAA